MPPQPLANYRRQCTRYFGPEALDHRPEFAKPIAHSIITAAHGEHDWSVFLSRLVGTQAYHMVDSYSAVQTDRARRDLIISSANTRLTDEFYRTFWAVLSVWSESCHDRHIFAHWISGWATELPDLLLFAHPDHLAEWGARIHANTDPRNLDDKKILAYRLANAETAASNIAEARQFILRIGDVLWLRNTDLANSQRTHELLIRQTRVEAALALYDRRHAAQGSSRPK
jgi:hypothetical protein